MNRRVALLAAVVAAGGAVTAVSWNTELPRAATRPASPTVALPATGLASTPVCPGPETLLAPAGGRPVTTGGTVAVGAVAQATDGSDSPGRATLGGMLVRAADGTGLLSLTRNAAGSVELKITQAGGTPLLSAVQLGLARKDDLRGLAAVACATASTQSWLVGGGTQVGRRERLLLANPTAMPAQVDVTVHGPDGPVEAPGGLGVVVPADGEVALRVDALAPGLSATAVHVQARSGRVVAVLQDNWVRGATPGGVDDVSAAAAPSRRQLVPGLAVAAGTGTALPSDPAAPGAVAVRVANPGRTDAVARVRLVGPSGTVTLAKPVLTVPAGGVRDVAVTGVDAGTYLAVVEADVPVVAGAVVGRAVAAGTAAGTPAAARQAVAPSEFALTTSVEPLAGAAVVALPTLTENGRRTSVGATLALAAPDGVATVEVLEVDGSGTVTGTRTVTLPAGTSAGQRLGAGVSAVRVRPVTRGADQGTASGVVAAVVLDVADAAGPMLSVLPVRSGPTGSGPRPSVVADPRVGLPA